MYSDEWYRLSKVSNSGSCSALLMSEKSQAVYYISSCHMLIDKALSSDKPNSLSARILHRAPPPGSKWTKIF